MTAPRAIMSEGAPSPTTARDESTPQSRSATPLRVPESSATPRPVPERSATNSRVPEASTMHPRASTAGQPPRIIIIGGGLAGMATAVALESTGANVTLLEARRTLGGRAGSYTDPQTGEELDNCQHVLLGCCTNLQDFYNRVGVANGIRYDRAIKFLDARGRRYALRGFANLPAPLHLGPSMLKFGALTWAERISAGRAMVAMMRLDRQGRDVLADVAFGDWLDEHRQSPALIEKLYDPVLIGALNEQTRRASAAYAIQVFQGSLLSNAGGYVMGVPAVPLSRLYEKLPCRDVRLATRVAELVFSPAGDAASITAVKLTNGEVLHADAVVLAVGFHAASRWLPKEIAARDERFAHLDRFESVPILGAHLRFDRPVMTDAHAALITGPLQWIFRKDDTGRSLHGVISAAREWVDRPKEECLRLFTGQLRSVLPAAREATLQSSSIVIEKRATFSPLPGVDRFRPAQAPPEAGGVPNLYLAGDYTRSGWPATMEGAVRSGYLAAEAIAAKVLAVAGSPPKFSVPDLPMQWPAKMMGRST